MTYDLYIKNGIVVTPKGSFQGGVAVSGEKIVQLLEGSPDLEAEKVEDVQGKIILPGLVDSHVHFHDPGRADWEGYPAGSKAALAGGVTTVIEMPLNGLPPTIDREKLLSKRAQIQNRSLVDYALWGGLVDDNVDQIEGLVQEGVAGLKAFMSGAATEEFPGVSDAQLYAGLKKSKTLGITIGLHAENGPVIDYLERKLQAEGRIDPKAWLESRPPETEIEAIRRLIYWSEVTGGYAHVVHVSLAEGVQLIQMSRARGNQITVETCPHFLVFTAEDFLREGFELKCDPPVRSRAEVEALWEKVLTGHISNIASDHAPCLLEDKHPASENIWDAWAGITGIQSMLPAIWTEGVRKRGLDASDLVRMMAANPAKIYGLCPQKGTLLPGADADVVIFDPHVSWELKADDLFSKNKHSAYVGKRFVGQVKQTYLRGQLVFKDGEFFAEPGYGRLLKRDVETTA